jgi:DNA-binding NtrC family response regulator
VAVNCAAIPAELVESELFGHERGAFSGAAAQRLGQFELADGGTLFLDEVGELPMAAQTKLLRALEQRTIRRIGGTADLAVDFRLVAATNADLEALVQAGRFRPSRELRRPLEGLAPGARAALLAHPWPGNVRELRNAIEQAVLREDSPRLSAGALFPSRVPGPPPGLAPAPAALPGEDLEGNLEEARRAFERRYLEHHLARNQGNMKATALEIGLSRANLYAKCRELGVDFARFR